MLSILLNGCGAGTMFNVANVQRIQPCQSTGEGAEELLGSPFRRGMEGNLTTRRWQYASFFSGYQEALVVTDGFDRVVDVTLNPSPTYIPINRVRIRSSNPP